MLNYDRSNWYWSVAGNANQVYSSASDAFVALNHPSYAAWLSKGNSPSRITQDDLTKIKIEILESGITSRRVREAVLGTDNGWLENIDTRITALRNQLS